MAQEPVRKKHALPVAVKQSVWGNPEEKNRNANGHAGVHVTRTDGNIARPTDITNDAQNDDPKGHLDGRVQRDVREKG